jgi:hypothetical protein
LTARTSTTRARWGGSGRRAPRRKRGRSAQGRSLTSVHRVPPAPPPQAIAWTGGRPPSRPCSKAGGGGARNASAPRFSQEAKGRLQHGEGPCRGEETPGVERHRGDERRPGMLGHGGRGLLGRGRPRGGRGVRPSGARRRGQLLRHRRGVRPRAVGGHPGRGPGAKARRRSRPTTSRPGRSARRARGASPISGPTASTSTRSTGRTGTSRSTRPPARSRTSCARARSAPSASPTSASAT